MQRLLQYLLVYKEFLSTCFAQAASFRLHFVLLIVMDLAFYFSTLASVDFIFAYVPKIGIWEREEFLFFIAFMLAVDHLHMTFVSENFWEFSYLVRTGGLDFLLLKPIGALFAVFFRLIRPATMVNGIVPWALMIKFGADAGLSSWSWALLPFLVLAALTLLVSLEILLSMSMFWVVQAWGINFLRMQFQQMSRWPDFVYHYLARKFFTIVVPILLIGSAPVKFLFDSNAWQPLAWMLTVTLITWGLIAFFWRKGLRIYESASS